MGQKAGDGAAVLMLRVPGAARERGGLEMAFLREGAEDAVGRCGLVRMDVGFDAMRSGAFGARTFRTGLGFAGAGGGV